MDSNIIRYGVFHLFFGCLNRKHFNISPIWCEYYEPSELDDIEEAGVPKAWLYDHILEPMKGSNEHPIYTIEGKTDYSKREFLYVYSELSILNYKLNGYLCVVAGKVSSIVIFLDDITVDLFSSELFADENKAALEELASFLGDKELKVDHINYSVKVGWVSQFPLEGEFSVPVDF